MNDAMLGEEIWAHFSIMGNFAAIEKVAKTTKKELQKTAQDFLRDQAAFGRYRRPINRNIRIVFNWYVPNIRNPLKIENIKSVFIDALFAEKIILKTDMSIIREIEIRFIQDKENPRVCIYLCKPKFNLI
jgi:hypothetical protein